MSKELFVSGEMFDSEDYPFTLFKWLVLKKFDQIDTKTSIVTYNKLSQIGLDDSATLKDIGFNIPLNTLLAIDVYANRNQSLPTPEIVRGKSQSGLLIAIKGQDNTKCNFIFMSNNWFAHCNYNTFFANPVNTWKLLSSGSPVVMTSSEVNGAIGNISISGDFYFDSTQSSALSDSPDSGGIFVSVKVTETGKIFEVIRNDGYPRKYIKQNGGSWCNIPIVGNQTLDGQLRIGDFKVGGDGKLYVKSENNVVKLV
ncbi:hypothetical protein [Providencia alcalifaciens]|uniref:hypothetical protein n=1 Tax=Providencia alcalifaciens TaxID=126385 RepID=UPI0012B5F216|nr:hypothetical protein [Providencia alcalifaciens]MTC16104.1 hypothetical protein [Providencia alcalifaciens]